MELPNQKQPCRNCPFRKDTELILQRESIEEYLNAESFVCHKTTGLEDKRWKQCAGHMILRGNKNSYVFLSKLWNVDLTLKGHDLVFDNDADYLKHHFGKTI